MDELKLVVERRIDAPTAAVWTAMTERLSDWFCPAPWRAEVVEQDWRPGGRSAMVFHGPDDEAMPQEGMILEVVPGRRWVATDAFATGWTPKEAFATMTFEVEPDSGDAGSLYRVVARHWTAEALEKHRAMGFEAGCAAAADQLAALVEGAAARPDAEVDGRPDQGPTSGVAPHLTIHDRRCREAIAWYGRAFGAVEAMPPTAAGDASGGEGMPDMGGDGRVMHAHLRINGGSVMMNDAFPEFVDPADRSTPDAPSAVTLHLQVDDADHWFARAVEAGATPTMPVSDMFWGDRYGQLRDPFGHRWSIGSAVRN